MFFFRNKFKCLAEKNSQSKQDQLQDSHESELWTTFFKPNIVVQEINPEMLELAKFAKHHIPEEHELDDQVPALSKCTIYTPVFTSVSDPGKNITDPDPDPA